MASLFSKIVAGEIPCYKIAENEEFFAFLDIMPLAEGHTLVVPKTETDYIFDLGDEELSRLMIFAKSVAKKVGKAIDCKKVGVAVIGLEVPHCHIHLVPLQNVSDINFEKEKLKLSPEKMQAIQKHILSA